MYKNLFLLLIAALLFTGCSTYRSGQTPDDVYYSPDQPDNNSVQYVNTDEDNYLRMKVQNYTRWGMLDDFDYWYDSRYYGNHFYAFNNPYSYWGFYPYSFGYSSYWFNFGFYPWGYSPWGFYSPYATIVYYKNRNTYYGNILNGNMWSYQNSLYNNTNYTQPQNTGKKSFGSLFKSNFSAREQNTNPYITSDKRNTPVRVFQPARPVQPVINGARSGGFKSTGSNMGSRPPKNN